MAGENQALVYLRLKEVLARTGMKSATLYRQMKAGEFPSCVRLGTGCAVGWVEAEISQWLTDRLQYRQYPRLSANVEGPSSDFIKSRAPKQPSAAVDSINFRSLTDQIAKLTPDLMVQLEGMDKPMRLADAMEALKAEVARDLELGRLVQVAADCHARNPS